MQVATTAQTLLNETVLPSDAEFQNDLKFGTPDLVNREATRYLFFAGDIITPRRKQERKDLAHGGEESASPCLWRARHFIRRGRITPLEYGPRWDIEPRVPAGTRTIAVIDHGGNPTILEGSALLGIPTYPGEAIFEIIATGDEGMPMGIVELNSLRGVDYVDVAKENYQHLFFPTYPNLPPTLRELEDTIRKVRSVESVVNEIKSDMLDSCARFRLYGTAKVEREHQLMRKPANEAGYVFGYSQLAETLLPQLEIPRQDQGLQTMAQLTGKITEAVLNQGATQTGPDYERIFGLIKENQEALVASMTAQFGALLVEAQANASAKDTSVKTAEPKKVGRPKKAE